jgi:hypothetical protein
MDDPFTYRGWAIAVTRDEIRFIRWQLRIQWFACSLLALIAALLWMETPDRAWAILLLLAINVVSLFALRAADRRWRELLQVFESD